MATKDYTRVCELCGTSWPLPKAWATEKAPRDSTVRAAQRATRWGRSSVRSLALQTNHDRVTSNARCPSCGSTSYKQYEPGQAPPVAPVQAELPSPAVPRAPLNDPDALVWPTRGP